MSNVKAKKFFNYGKNQDLKKIEELLHQFPNLYFGKIHRDCDGNHKDSHYKFYDDTQNRIGSFLLQVDINHIAYDVRFNLYFNNSLYSNDRTIVVEKSSLSDKYLILKNVLENGIEKTIDELNKKKENKLNLIKNLKGSLKQLENKVRIVRNKIGTLTSELTY
jgi:hypothetical protein